MGLKEILENLQGSSNDRDDDIDDNVTRDKYLRTLRRQRRIQLEEVEKEQLKKKIVAFQKAREQKYLWGLKKKVAQKKVDITRNGNPILKQKRKFLSKFKI